MKKKSRRMCGGGWKYRGIAVHAEELGVNRSHLWRVLTGQRESRSLKARYAALTGKQAG